MSYCYARFWSGSRPNSQNFEGDFEFYGTAQNVFNFLSGLSFSNITWYNNNNTPRQYNWDIFLDLLESNLNILCGGGIPQTPFVLFSFGDINEYLTYFLGKRFTFDLHLYVNSDLAIRFDFAFSDSNPSSNNIIPDCNISYLYDNVCSRTDSQTLSEQIQELKDAFSANYNTLIFNIVGGFTSFPWNGVDCNPHDYNPPVVCEDLRTSFPPHTLRFTITNGELSVTKDLDCYCTASDNVFPFDSSVFTNQEVKDIFTMFMQYGAKRVRCAARFISGNVRSNCSVKLNVSVTGFRCYCDIIGPYFGIGSEELTPTIKQCFDASFVECFDKPISYTENLSTYCEGLVNTGDGWCIFLDPQNITVSNLECETDVCCDDASESEIDEIETPQIETLGGFISGGGGSDVDISCICDGLTSLNQMLATKLDNLVDGQAVIADAISEMQVEVDNTCVCDNLENISDGVIAIKEAIDDKNLSVVNNNTVQPPVNNISVQPPVNNISLPTTQLENIATNTRALNCVCASLQNLEVIEQGTKESIDGVKFNLQCGKDDNISCILNNVNSNLSNIAESLVCGNDGIACILQGKDLSVDVDLNTADISNGLEAITQKLDDIDNSVHDGLINSDDESNLEIISQSLNTSDDEPISLADVIKNKDMGTNIDVEVSPADDVNINRVYYTNQRNGETSI